MVSLIYVGVGISMLSFFMSMGRLLNCLVVVENMAVLLILITLLSHSSVLYLSFLVMFTIESALSLVVLFRVWDISVLSDVVGR